MLQQNDVFCQANLLSQGTELSEEDTLGAAN